MTSSQMSKGPTAAELVCVLDRSGSMTTSVAATREGFDSLIREQREVPGECFVSLYQFDHDYDVVYEGKRIAEVPPLHLMPRGSTALYDAIGRTIGTALARITDPSRKVVIIIMTDGGENASRGHTAASVGNLLSKARSKGWECVFIGANEDSIMSARAAGFTQVNTLYMTQNHAGTAAAYGSTSSNLRDYRVGNKADMSWTAEDRKKQEDAKTQSQ